MLLNLTQMPTNIEQVFFSELLGETDCILVSAAALPLIFQANIWSATAYVKQQDANKMGGTLHKDWSTIDDQRWVQLTTLSTKTVTW